LNHIGVPLDLNSASHIPCVAQYQEQHNDTKQKLLDCLEDKNYWDDRSFTVPVDTVIYILEQFIVNGMGIKNSNEHSTSTSNTTRPIPLLKYCKDFQQIAGDEIVLYNVNCVMSDKQSSVIVPHHFYRTTHWLESKTHSSLK
jgi:hypothetical protein